MSHSSQPRPSSRSIPIFMGTVMLLAILLAAFGRMAGLATSKPTALPVASRELLFRDQPNGAVAIFDTKDAATPISIAAPGTNGFLRATMRGLARQRLRQDSDRAADEAVPFRLTEWADGRLTLEDTTTHRTVEMEAFGITNEEVFAHLLTAPLPTPLPTGRPVTEQAGP
ncbi:photosynthetic complex assembly protein PuhC [Rhodopila sp.]|uniref:photosynthetic complex assembly protein PuhC n=1 Tax=Rhodopila sp. TaxID=2480087 RepID=UPI003D0AE164